jgi:hypothetical protein
MITAIEGPLIVQPDSWTLVFDRRASTWWASWFALGRHKHVRAYAYVPFLHVWVFFDPHLSGTDLIVAADGEAANRLIASWIVDADLVRMRRRATGRRPAIVGWCVPSVKRLIGLRCVALRPSGFYRQCLKHGGEPFEAHGSTPISTAAA